MRHMSLYNTLYKQVTVESRMLEMKSLKKKNHITLFLEHTLCTLLHLKIEQIELLHSVR